MATPFFQYSYLRNPMDTGTWGVTVHGAIKSQTKLSKWTHKGVLNDLSSEVTPVISATSYCIQILKAGEKGDDRGWSDWMASPTRWTWVWVSSRSEWWTDKPGVLQSMGLQRVGHDWATELKWTDCLHRSVLFSKKGITGGVSAKTQNNLSTFWREATTTYI